MFEDYGIFVENLGDFYLIRGESGGSLKILSALGVDLCEWIAKSR